VNEQLITEYLLGAASEYEQERLDEMSLTDDEFVDRLRAIENDLIDSYVTGELSGDALTRFNAHYLASPRRREKVEFAETFLGFADRSVAPQARDTRATASASPETQETIRREALRPRFFALLRPTLQWGLAAAALVILLGGGYLFVENLRLRNQMAQTQAERAALEQREQELQQQLDQQRSLDAETEKELAQVRDRLTQLEQQLTAGQQQAKPEPEQRDAKVLAFNLSPQTRGIGPIPTLAVPAGTDYVALILELEGADFPAYRAALKNRATGQILWRSDKLKTSGKNKVLSVSLRASLLNSQNYVLDLSGISAKGVAENIGSYAFKVAKQ
jgi:uncharacterized membrane-anchored protein YhcB (DUF1043 family)